LKPVYQVVPDYQSSETAMAFTYDFLTAFFLGIWLIFPLLVFFMLLIFVLGQLVGRVEQWTPFNSFYWAFITAFTVGYGDMRPSKKSSKVTSIFIALIGIMFTGVIVAITVAAATESFNKNVKAEVVEHIKKNL